VVLPFPVIGNDAPAKIITPIRIDYFNLYASVFIARHNGFIALIYWDLSAKRSVRETQRRAVGKGHMQPVVIYDPFGGFLRGEW
jgi:hypothetical protein